MIAKAKSVQPNDQIEKLTILDTPIQSINQRLETTRIIRHKM